MEIYKRHTETKPNNSPGPLGVQLPHVYGKILIVILRPLGCPLDSLSCFQKNIGGPVDIRLFLEYYRGNFSKND